MRSVHQTMMLHVSQILASGAPLPFKIKIKRYDDHELMVLNYESFERERTHPAVVECRGLICTCAPTT